MWLWFGLNVTLLLALIIQHYRCIIMHYTYVHNALWMDALSKVSL